MELNVRLKKYVRHEHASKSLQEVLAEPITILNGVSMAAAEALKPLMIDTVFSLANNRIFNVGFTIFNEGSSNNEKLDKNFWSALEIVDIKENISRHEVLNLSIDNLLALSGKSYSKTIQEALAVRSIGELSMWPPFLAAKEMFELRDDVKPNANSNPESPEDWIPKNSFNPTEIEYAAKEMFELSDDVKPNNNSDPESPEDLIPKNSLNPTEIVYYDSIVLIPDPEEKTSDELTDIANGRVSISFESDDLGFNKPAFGTVLTYSQAWYSQNVSLGSLLYSLPLAPGESTKIAIIDWTRRTGATTTELIDQTEQLANSMVQNRAVSEVAEATAFELQAGASGSSSVSSSSSAGVGAGGNLAGALVGGTAATSLNGTISASFSVSTGLRNMAASMAQNIVDSTNQNAFSARNKRASIVSETYHKENEQIRTRTVTNYNHMHALTIQYYEVVQNYKVEVKLDKHKKCIFVPFEFFDFTDNRIINNFKTILINSTVDPFIRNALIKGFEDVVVECERELYFESIQVNDANETKNRIARAIRRQDQDHFKQELSILKSKGIITKVEHSNLSTLNINSGASIINVKWNRKIKNIIVKTIEEEIILDISANDLTSYELNPAFEEELSVTAITEIIIVPDGDVRDLFTVEILFGIYNNYGSITFHYEEDEPGNHILLKFEKLSQAIDIYEHLNQNKIYYSQQIWMNADTSFLITQLSRYRIHDIKLTDYINPRPIAISGNYLIFIWNNQVYPKHIEQWINSNIGDKDQIITQIVALPTSGIFAEAVLGRSNSAEKLDITRFWNWQDSPIPIQAPDIVPVAAGNHEVDQPQKAGSLETPIVNIMNPAPLPDPTGMQGILQAITVSNMFRDMSSSTQTGALAQSALNAASQGAAQASTQAGANMATAGQFYTEMAKVAASMAPMLFGLPPVPSTGTSNISNAGASINHGSKMDTQGQGNISNLNPILFEGLQGVPGGNAAAPIRRTGQSNEKAAFDKTVGRPPDYTSSMLTKPSRTGIRSFILRFAFKEERGTPLEGIFSITIIPVNQQQRKTFDEQQLEVGGFLQLENIELEDTDEKIPLIVSGYLEVDGQSLADRFTGQNFLSLPYENNIIDVSVGLKFTQTEVKATSEIKAIEKKMNEAGFHINFKNLFSASAKGIIKSAEVAGSEESEVSGGGNMNNSESNENNTGSVTETTWVVRYPIPGLILEQIVR